MRSGYIPCSECGDPVPIAGPDDRAAGVMCLECAEGGVGQNIDILYYPVAAATERRSIPNRLEAFQQLVGGYIELLGIGPLGSGIYIVYNEDGRRETVAPESSGE